MPSLRRPTVLVGTITLAAALAACTQPSNTSTAGTAAQPSGGYVATGAPSGTAAGAGSTGGALAAGKGCTSTVKPVTASTQSAQLPVDAPAGSPLAGVRAEGAVDHKTAPKVTFATTPVSVDTVTRVVLEPGEGDAASRDAIVTTRLALYNGSTGKLLDDGFAADRGAESFQLSRADLLPGLTQGLLGTKKNMRLVFAIPPKDAFGETGNAQLGIGPKDTIVVVGDVSEIKVVSSTLGGSMTQAPATMPQVSFPNGPDQAPQVTVPAGAQPTETEQAVLIEGTGPVVQAGQKISANYHGVIWTTCATFDSSWERGAPTEFPIGTGGVVKGWDQTLVGKKVGSRVLLAIPPQDGYGDSDQAPEELRTNVLIFVVDILDAHN